MVGGAVLIATGAACIVLTGGAATPIVADVAVAVGSGTAVFFIFLCKITQALLPDSKAFYLLICSGIQNL